MNSKFLTPAALEAELKKKIRGQDGYLHDLATCLWLHSQRREHFLRTGQRISKPKYNMLVVGKSGMGKTSAIQAAADLLDIPVVIEDASEFRGAGWKGRQVSEIIRDVKEAATPKKEKSDTLEEYAIVVLDEIDKIFGQHTTDSSFSPVSNLLKLIEGTESGYGEGTNRVRMRTDDILFICVGAFDGLEKIIEKRMKPQIVGFSTAEIGSEIPEQDLLKEVTTKDLVAYGVSEQLLGRLPLITVMNELKSVDYEEILLQSEISPIRQLNNLLQQEQGVSVSISEKAARELAVRVMDSKLGARALQREVINLLKDTLYEIPYTECKGYHLDYEENFIIQKIPGVRSIPYDKKKNIGLHLSTEEREHCHMVSLDSIREDEDAIQVYAERMFEPYERKGYSDYPASGLTDIYDYLTIRQAQFFTAAAITKLFIETKHEGGKTKNMAALLHTICMMSVDTGEGSLHPLEKTKREFLSRLQSCSKDKIKELREISWTVVRKFALLLYKLDFMTEEEDDDDEYWG